MVEGMVCKGIVQLDAAQKKPLHGRKRGEDREITRRYSTVSLPGMTPDTLTGIYRLNTFIAPPPGAALNLTSSL